MHIALNINVQVQDDTLVLTDCSGKTITFSKEGFPIVTAKFWSLRNAEGH